MLVARGLTYASAGFNSLFEMQVMVTFKEAYDAVKSFNSLFEMRHTPTAHLVPFRKRVLLFQFSI